MRVVVITTEEGILADNFQRFTALLGSINRSISRLKSDAVSRFSLKRSHVSVIYFIFRDVSTTLSRLSLLTGEDKANISRTIRALVDDGYVTYSEKTSPHARTRVTLTDKGREIGEHLHSRVVELVSVASSDIAKDKLDVMYDCLEQIDTNLRGVADGDAENKNQ